jgi:hypothetical protein
MQANVSSDGKTFTFNFVDATNLSAPDAGRMQKLVLTLLDDNHHTPKIGPSSTTEKNERILRSSPQAVTTSVCGAAGILVRRA